MQCLLFSFDFTDLKIEGYRGYVGKEVAKEEKEALRKHF